MLLHHDNNIMKIFCNGFSRTIWSRLILNSIWLEDLPGCTEVLGGWIFLRILHVQYSSPLQRNEYNGMELKTHVLEYIFIIKYHYNSTTINFERNTLNFLIFPTAAYKMYQTLIMSRMQLCIPFPYNCPHFLQTSTRIMITLR